MHNFEDKIIDFATKNHFSYKKYSSVFPLSPYKDAEFVFMNAMSRPSIYLGDFPNKLSPEISLVRCIRRGTDIQKIASSTRHMSAFDMIGFSLSTSRNDAIKLTLSLLRTLLDPKCIISTRVHPEDLESKDILRSLKVSFTDDETCYFNIPNKTNRSGFRVEFYATANSQIVWELQNLILIDHLDNHAIKYCLAQTGGSIERILALNEQTYDVYKTDAYNLNYIRSFVSVGDVTLDKHLANLARTITTLLGSGIMPGNLNKRERIFRDYCLMFAESCISAGIEIEQIHFIFDKSLDSEKIWINPIIISSKDLILFKLIFDSLLGKAVIKVDLDPSHHKDKNIWYDVKNIIQNRHFSKANDWYINQNPAVIITNASMTASSLFLKNLSTTNDYRKITYNVYGLFDHKFILKLNNIMNRTAHLAPILTNIEPTTPYEIIAYRILDNNDLSVVVVQQFENEINMNYILSKRNSLQFDLHDVEIDRYELDNTHKTLKIFRNKIEKYYTTNTDFTKSS